MKRNILVLGGGYAGLMACNRLAKINKNITVTLVNDSEEFIERIRNHEIVAGKEKNPILISHLIHKQVRFLKGKVLKIYPDAKEVELENRTPRLKYDALIYAMGSTKLPRENSGENVITKEGSNSIFQRIQNQKEGQVWIVGGGLTGIELATEWKESYPHWKVGIVDRNTFASTFSVNGQNYLRESFQRMQIEILENTEVLKLQDRKILFKNGRISDCDVSVDTTGFASSKVATLSGFRTNEKNQILVNRFLQVPDYPEVFVAGDACYLADSHLRMGCVTALPLGAHAAENINQFLRNKNLQEFRFRFMGRCLSLGRKNGLIQMTDENDSPKETIYIGKLGASLKEMICKYTLLSIQLEKWLFFRTYQWPKQKVSNKIPSLEKSYE